MMWNCYNGRSKAQKTSSDLSSLNHCWASSCYPPMLFEVFVKSFHQRPFILVMHIVMADTISTSLIFDTSPSCSAQSSFFIIFIISQVELIKLHSIQRSASEYRHQFIKSYAAINVYTKILYQGFQTFKNFWIDIKAVLN